MTSGNNSSSNSGSNSHTNNHTNNTTTNNNNVLQQRIIITPQQYLYNRQWIQQEAARLMEFNTRGVEAYLTAQAVLQQKVAEGERARQQLQSIQQIAYGQSVAGASSNPSGPSQYSTSTSLVNPPASLVPRNYGNTRNAGVIMTDAQNSYSSYVAPANAGPSIQEISSPPPGQSNASSGSAFHRPPPQSFNTQSTIGGRSLQTVPVQSHDVYPRPSQGGAIGSANLMQPLFQHPLAHGQPSLTNSATAPGPSTLRTQVAQRPVNNTNPVSQKLSRAEQPSGSRPIAGPTAGSSYRVAVSGSSSSSSALAGALGETSSAQAQRSSTNSYTSADILDFWTAIENEKRAKAGMRTREAQTRIDAQTSPANHQEPVIVYAASEQRRETPTVMPPVSTAYPAPGKKYSRAQLAEARAEINDISYQHSHPNQINAPNLTAHILQLRGVSDYQNASTWYSQAPVMPASSGPSSSADVAPLSSLRPTGALTSTNHSQGPLHAFSGSSTSAFVADPSGLDYRPYGAQTSSPNFASADQRNSPYVTPAATVANAISTQNHSGSSGSTIRNSYSTAVEYSSTIGNPLSSSHVASHSNGARYMTPPSDRNKPSDPITPASANRKTIAKDILRALNVSAEKRKASSSPETSDDDQRPVAKKQAVGPSPIDIQVLISDVFTMTSALPVADTGDSARIEEVVETPAQNHLTNLSSPPAVSTVDDVRDKSPKVTEVTEQDEPPVADPLPPDEPAVESRASSEDIIEVDTALQPFKESSMPLFLPTPDSPPLSTSRGKGARTSRIRPLTSRSTGSEGGWRHRKQVYVEVPMLTDAQRRLFLRQDVSGNEGDEKESRDLLSVLRTQGSSRAATSTVPRVNDADENRIRLAQEANKVAASRLLRRPCLWSDCFHVSNCANSLEFHVGDHVALIQDKEKIFACWWGECMRKFNKREVLAQHLQHHVKKSIYCAYQGCEEQFTRPLELLSHVENKHPHRSLLRPSVAPFAPSLQITPLPALKPMLAFYDVPIPVRMSQMSNDWRAKLGPWVAQKCFGAVNLGTPRLAARKPNQRRRPGEGEAKLLGDWQDRYDFLEALGTKYPSDCSELESLKATEEIEAGLLLAPDIAGPQGPLEEHLLTSRVDRIKLDGSQEYAILAEGGLEDPEVPAEVAEIKLEPMMSDPVPQELQVPPTASQELQVPPTASQETMGSPAPAYKDFLGVGEPQLVELGTA